MNSKPLVTVFIPYYNDNKYLRQSIESVLNNDYENFELILLNHATTDNCREIAHSYNDSRIKHIDMEKNLGAGGGILFEKMLNMASGKYIKPLCADDLLRKDGLTTLVEYMENNPNKDFAFGNVEYIDKDSNDLNDNWFNSRENFSINNDEIDCLKLYLRCIGYLPYIGSIIKLEKLKNIKIEKTYVMLFDMSLWIKLLCNDCKIGFIDYLVCDYRIHEGQCSALCNQNKSEAYGLHEYKTYWAMFLEINSIELAKKLYPKSKFVDRLDTVKDIPFFIAHNMFINKILSGNSSVYIQKLLNDKEQREYLENKFNYGIREYREEIIELSKNKFKGFKKFKNQIYAKPVKKLGLRDLSFLFIHRIFNIITLKPLREYLKNKKRYSL